MNKHDWQSVLARNWSPNFRQKPIDLCMLHRAKVYRDTASCSEALLRSRAFASALRNIDIHIDQGWLVGNCWGLTSGKLPEGMGEQEYQQLLTVHSLHRQRDFWAGFDHSLADYPTLLQIGIAGYRDRIRTAIHRHGALAVQHTLQAFDVTLNALSAFIIRCATAARQAGNEKQAQLCESVANRPPEHFAQALQLIWLVHLAFKTEGRCHMALGRMDQYLLPFYLHDIELGLLTQESALDWLCHMWTRLDEIGEVQNICIGGLKPDGSDGTNALSYLCLEATRQVGSPYTNLSARLHDQTPEAFHRACFDVLRTGIGFPALFNDHVLIPGLEEIGIPPEVARDACMVGCIETMLAGRQPPWSDSRFNTPLTLLDAMEKLRTTSRPSYPLLIRLFREELAKDIATHVLMVNNHIAHYPVEKYPDPFLSALTRNCIEQGLDIHNGGAEFPRFHGIAIMGLATLADSLAAVKKLVFEKKALSYADLMDILTRNFEGAEDVRLMLVNSAPKYGNDIPYVDHIAADIVKWTSDVCLEHRL
ncbi:MAG: pyruvate formate lyase family protein, partial [Anaerolineae bacterium]|nr:pyruvate formate lyase family protein [Anaerolineae bacterium]